MSVALMGLDVSGRAAVGGRHGMASDTEPSAEGDGNAAAAAAAAEGEGEGGQAAAEGGGGRGGKTLLGP